MDKKIIIGAISIVVIGGVMLIANMPKSEHKSACFEVCKEASQTCPSLINESNCNKNCSKLSDEAKKHLADSKTCQELTAKPELIADLLIPEVVTPEQKGNVSEDDCQMACMNYAIKCLTLVPNATNELLDEGRESCMKECKKWNNEKIDCMLNAIDCPSMTDVCGL